jgi:hypothetical protein
LGREISTLKGAIDRAEREKDSAKLAELLAAKSELDKRIRASGGRENDVRPPK